MKRAIANKVRVSVCERRWTRSVGGFTLIEMLVSLAVVALLIGLVSVGVRGAVRASRSAAEQQAALAVKQAVDQFHQTYGFYPPLMKRSSSADTLDLLEKSGTDTEYRLNVYRTGRSGGVDDEALLRDRIAKRGSGGSGVENAFEDERYSEFSLSTYLLGVGAGECSRATGKPLATEDPIDGVVNTGAATMGTPLSDGTFEAVHNQKSAKGVQTRRAPGAQESLLAVGGGNGLQLKDTPPAGSTEFEKHMVLANRKGVAIRYYRWLNGTKPASGSIKFDALEDYKVPRMVGRLRGAAENGRLTISTNFTSDLVPDDRNIEKNALLRSRSLTLREAGYAIVLAGPNSVFGDETDLLTLSAGSGLRADPTIPITVERSRLAAEKDNIVLIGQ